MGIMFQIFKFIYLKVLFLLSLVFFISCDDFGVKKEPVSSGNVQTEKLIFSKSCSGGTFHVYHKRNVVAGVSPSDNSSSPSLNSLQELKQGDIVRISGTVFDASPCSNSSVPFSCSARVSIDTNRSFICESGNAFSSSAIPSSTNSLSVQNSTTSSTVGVSTGRAFLGGLFQTFQNGHQAYGRIVLESSSQYVPQAQCVISFSCL